jgi:hypothetical protein
MGYGCSVVGMDARAEHGTKLRHLNRWPEPFADRATMVIVIAGTFPRISVSGMLRTDDRKSSQTTSCRLDEWSVILNTCFHVDHSKSDSRPARRIGSVKAKPVARLERSPKTRCFPRLETSRSRRWPTRLSMARVKSWKTL